MNAITLTATDFDANRHNGEITLTSPVSGEHRTFRIRTKQGDGPLAGKRILSLLVGPDNEGDYQGFAFVGDDGRVKVWQKNRGQNGERSQWERYADLIERPGYWSGRGVEYLVSARCHRCNRKLTVPASIASGYGPECINMV